MSETIAFSQSSKGWTSFFSYIPERMVGMNNYFYSFKNGELYRHNTNETRNNFYGTQYNTQVLTILNEGPLDSKLLKTIELQGDSVWDITINTDLETSGYIEKEWFEKKEQAWFAFVRSTDTIPANSEQLVQRSVNGISKSSSVSSGTPAAVVVNFALTVDIGSRHSIGDYLYYSVSPYTTINVAGVITNIEIDKPNSINRITYDSTVGGGSIPANQDDLWLTVKNQTAESHGSLGHYHLLAMTNDSTTEIELFSVAGQIMKSFP